MNPSPRCSFATTWTGSHYCRRQGEYQRQVPGESLPRTLCAEHAVAADAPHDPRAPYRRVEVQLSVYLAAVGPDADQAEAEAAELCRHALSAVGGLVSLVAVYSVVGQPAGPVTLARLPVGREGG